MQAAANSRVMLSMDVSFRLSGGSDLRSLSPQTQKGLKGGHRTDRMVSSVLNDALIAQPINNQGHMP